MRWGGARGGNAKAILDLSASFRLTPFGFIWAHFVYQSAFGQPGASTLAPMSGWGAAALRTPFSLSRPLGFPSGILLLLDNPVFDAKWLWIALFIKHDTCAWTPNNAFGGLCLGSLLWNSFGISKKLAIGKQSVGFCLNFMATMTSHSPDDSDLLFSNFPDS